MVNDNTPTKQRLLIQFGKFDALKFTSNLDVAKIWERVLRRANLPILYSKGFNTRPRIQLASALALGISSESEFVEVSLKEVIPLDGVLEQIRAVSPAGLRIYSVSEASIHTPALQTLVRSSEYRIQFQDGIDRNALHERVEALLAKPQIIKIEERGGRKSGYDLRPMIYSLRIDDNGDLLAHVATGDLGNVRPDDLLRELGLDAYPINIHRVRLHIEVSK